MPLASSSKKRLSTATPGASVFGRWTDATSLSLTSFLPKKMFVRYRCDVPATLGINLVNVAKSLKCANNDDTFTMRHDQKPDEVRLTFEEHDKCKLQESKLTLLNLTDEAFEMPDTQYDVILKCSSTEFAKTCRDISQFAESVVITACKESVIFSGKGENGEHNIIYINDNVDENGNKQTVVEVSCSKPVSLTFSIRYLLKFAKAGNISDRISLSLKENVPLRIEYRIHDTGFLRYYLAPKIKEDEF